MMYQNPYYENIHKWSRRRYQWRKSRLTAMRDKLRQEASKHKFFANARQFNYRFGVNNKNFKMIRKRTPTEVAQQKRDAMWRNRVQDERRKIEERWKVEELKEWGKWYYKNRQR